MATNSDAVRLFVIFCLASSLQSIINCETYTSVDGLASWSDETVSFIDNLDSLIKLQEERLIELRRAQESLLPIKDAVKNIKALVDPVHVFVTLRRLSYSYEIARMILKEDSNPMELYDEDVASYFNLYDEAPNTSEDKFQARINEDLKGSGIALLRLQAFYNLDPRHLINGNVVPNGTDAFKMSAKDCFELGRIAYHDRQYSLSISWLYMALDMNKREIWDLDGEQLIDESLDHMAFAAYKLGFLEYAANLTRAYLGRNPDSQRAQENLEYYVAELNAPKNRTFEPYSQEQDEEELDLDLDPDKKYPQYYRRVSVDKYLVEEDEIVRRLCRRTELSVETSHKCHYLTAPTAAAYFYSGIKVEVLSEDPKVVRIYDVISPGEAKHLQNLARPKLQRATIKLSNGQQTSNFRIAQTAWISSESDTVARRIEDRLADMLDMSMEQSELLQVVNYGLGGFYGPHLDSARPSSGDGNYSVVDRGDRYATILIYLDDVDVGGSTVFPLLDLTVTPVGRSAVIWFNILDNGYSDVRVLHTGCPVSLGSKWIAVKWLREETNFFPRPNQWWRRQDP